MIKANREDVLNHKVPKWYEDAKIGIFIHFGLYSVPAFAPLNDELGNIPLDDRWYAYNPYAEWYLNSLRIGFGPTYEYHLKTYGKDYPYNKFIEGFTLENFKAKEWIDLFKEAGAKYIVLTTKHHDGYCLWDSEYTDFNSVKKGPGIDILDELNKELKKTDIRLGTYYSGIIDWTYSKKAMRSQYEVDHPDNDSKEYAEYAYNQVKELIDKYHPSVLWNDIFWPYKGWDDLPKLLSYYYNEVSDGVINDRWGDGYFDYSTKEYNMGQKDKSHKWEMTRGIGHSFGYNKNEKEEDLISSYDLIKLLIDTVAYNGNLLINIGPKADGSICLMQAKRLKDLGAWLKINGEAIYKTRPYIRNSEDIDGARLYYSQNDDYIYMFIVDINKKSFVIPLVSEDVTVLSNSILQLTNRGDSFRIDLEDLRQIIVLRFKKV